MKRSRWLMILLAAAAAGVAPAPGTPAGAGEVPAVTVHRQSPALTYFMYPEFYRSYEDAVADSVRPVENLEAVIRFWEAQGAGMLAAVSELSGIEWSEGRIDLYLVEDCPTWGGWDPMVYAVDNWRRGDVVRLAPREDAVPFVFAYLFTQRLFAQVPPDRMPEAMRHPLFRPGHGTRHALACLVAYWYTAQLLGEERAMAVATGQDLLYAAQSLEMLTERLLPAGWRLSKDRPLTAWVKDEPTDSPLLKAALTARERNLLGAVTGRTPGKRLERSRIGLRVRMNELGSAEVVAVVPGQFGERAGLRRGDQVIRVGGVAVKDSRDLLARCIALLKRAGEVGLLVERDGELFDTVMTMAWLRPE